MINGKLFTLLLVFCLLCSQLLCGSFACEILLVTSTGANKQNVTQSHWCQQHREQCSVLHSLSEYHQRKQLEASAGCRPQSNTPPGIGR